MFCSLIPPLSRWLCLITIGWATFYLPVFADSDVANPVTITMSPAGDTVMQGEPIVLHYQITNPSGQDAYIDLGDGRNTWDWENNTSWFQIGLIDSTGKSAPAIPNPPRPYMGAFAAGTRLPSGSVYQNSLVATQWVSVPHPGRYRLSVQVQLRYMYGADQANPPAFSVERFSFPLTITAPDPTHLRATADSLREGFLTSQAPVQKITLLQSLFSMPEQSSLPVWQALLSDPRLDDQSSVAGELARVNSDGAAILLAQMFWNPAQSGRSEARSIVHMHLDGMYRRGNALIKRHIEQLFANHGSQYLPAPVRLD